MKRRNGRGLSNDEEAVVVPLYMLLIGILILGVAIVAAWMLGVLVPLVGAALIVMGAFFVLQILPPRGWNGLIIGSVPIALGIILIAWLG